METARNTKLGVALIQFDTKETLPETLQHLSDIVEKTVAQYKPRVIALPEPFTYFYRSSNEVFWSAAEPIDGTTVKHMSMLAKKFNIYLVGGIVELDSGKIYNTAVVFNPEGEMIARHRKVHLCAIDFENGTKLDESAFTAGDDATVFQIDDIKCGVVVCNDAVFEEFVKIYRKLGVELLFVPAAYNYYPPAEKYSIHNHWETVHKARAFDNQFYVAAINGAQNEKIKDFMLWGHTMLIDPLGRIVKQAGTKEEVVYQEIDVSIIKKLHNEFPTYKGRRKDVYDKYAHIYESK